MFRYPYGGHLDALAPTELVVDRPVYIIGNPVSNSCAADLGAILAEPLHCSSVKKQALSMIVVLTICRRRRRDCLLVSSFQLPRYSSCTGSVSVEVNISQLIFFEG